MNEAFACDNPPPYKNGKENCPSYYGCHTHGNGYNCDCTEFCWYNDGCCVADEPMAWKASSAEPFDDPSESAFYGDEDPNGCPPMEPVQEKTNMPSFEDFESTCGVAAACETDWDNFMAEHAAFMTNDHELAWTEVGEL